MGILRPLIFVLATTELASPARAEEAQVRVGGACVPPGTSLEETLSILKAELSPVSVAMLDGAPPSIGGTNVVIAIDACTVDPPGARVTVWTNGVPQVRSVDLTGLELEARPRTLALALAEATRDFAAPIFAAAAPPIPPAPVVENAVPQPVGLRPDDRDRRQAASAVSLGDARSRGSAVPRIAALFRFVASPATALGGGEVGVAFRRVALSVSALATERSVSLGSAALLAVFASPSVDLVDFGANTSLRITGELGFVTGSGSPNAPATASSGSTAHLGLDAGIATLFPLGAGWALDGTIQAAYASSLILRAEGRELVGLDGFSLIASVGVDVPFSP